jgi:nitrite reductase/ring-hydroxylating ferredoxin subunit
MGPLGEGCVVDGLVTCPWHGWQYDPTTGRAPPPYTERVDTFAVRIENGRVFVSPKPNAKGAPATPAAIG